jgi:alpha-tubulin suppressor-like RCC1 family protein
LPAPIGDINGGGIALGSGELYVTTGQPTNSVSAFDLTLARRALPSGAFSGLSVPRGIAFDPSDGEFYVGNGAATVNVFSATGAALSVTDGFPGYYGPSGVAYDPDDETLWVANYVGAPAASPPVHGVAEYTANGAAAQTFDYASQFAPPAPHVEPYSITVCPAASTGGQTTVVVGFIDDGSGLGTGAVQSYTTSGAPIGSTFSGTITRPYALSCNAQGDVYIADVTGLHVVNTRGTAQPLPGSFAGLTPPLYGVLAGALAAPTTATALATGSAFACALLTGGAVECWGGNGSGQLGNGTTAGSSTPSRVAGLSGVTAIAAGLDFACAIVAGGAVECWGDNDVGQLGNGTTTSSSTPVAVSGLTGVSAITAGSDFACALLSAGPVECWGDNDFGALGNGTTTSSSTPVVVSPVSGVANTGTNATSVIAISAGGFHACAIYSYSDQPGTFLACWGDNTYGELGIATSGPQACPGGIPCSTAPVVADGNPLPTPIPAGATQLGLPVEVAAVAAGAFETCAEIGIPFAGPALYCWGLDDFGVLGNGATEASTCASIPCSVAPIQAIGLPAIADGGLGPFVVSVSAGTTHACANLSDGTVECWGDNALGELGNGTSTGPLTCSGPPFFGGVLCNQGATGGCAGFACSTPAAVGALTDVSTISAGGNFSCALLSRGTVECWGSNDSGQLGIGTASGPDSCSYTGQTFACSTSPVSVSGL